MAIEKKRGCGYRKAGGTYLVCDPLSAPCDRLPILLDVCPCCGGGVKFTRGFTWIKPQSLFEGDHDSGLKNGFLKLLGNGCTCDPQCPACFPTKHFPNGEKAGLLWVGKKFYTVDAFMKEAGEMGISKRIATLPKEIQVGKTWIFLAHQEAGQKDDKPAGGIFMAFRPKRIERIVLDSEMEIYQWGLEILNRGGEVAFNTPEEFKTFKTLKNCVDRGMTLVAVPDDDPDHNP